MRRALVVLAAALTGVAAAYAVRILLDESAEGDLPAPLAVARADVAAVLGDLGGVVADIRSGAATREQELRVALGLDQPGPGGRLDPQATKDLLDDPVGWRAPRG